MHSSKNAIDPSTSFKVLSIFGKGDDSFIVEFIVGKTKVTRERLRLAADWDPDAPYHIAASMLNFCLFFCLPQACKQRAVMV